MAMKKPAAAPKQEVVAPQKNAHLPAYLQNAERTAAFGNTDQSDFILPRVKLMQSLSPELDTYDNAVKGEFWHTLLNESFGEEFPVIPVKLRKTVVLWAPRGDDRGILARASDAVNWDVPDLEFEVTPKGSSKKVTYSLGKTVKESGLAEFGSSNPNEENSKPAASLTYEFMFLHADKPELGPFLVYCTRSAIKPGKDLISKVELRNVDPFAQRYLMKAVDAKNTDGDEYKNYLFVADGYVDEDTYNFAKEVYERFKEGGYRASDESEEDAAESGSGPRDSNKY